VSRPALGPAQLSVQWVQGGPFPGAKALPGRDADHSPPLLPKSRMSRSYTSSPPSTSMACSRTALAFSIAFQTCLQRKQPYGAMHVTYVCVCLYESCYFVNERTSLKTTDRKAAFTTNAFKNTECKSGIRNIQSIYNTGYLSTYLDFCDSYVLNNGTVTQDCCYSFHSTVFSFQ
jgi:hypothetical protein